MHIYFIIGNAKLTLPKRNVINLSVKTEIKVAFLILHHITFFNLSIHMMQFIKNEFKGITAAKKYLGEDIKKGLIKDRSSSLYSLMVHGSNGAGFRKMFCIIMCIFDVTFNWIMTIFFDMNMLQGIDASTGEFMFTSIDQQLVENELSWGMVSVIGLDKTNVNIKYHNSIKSRVI